MSVHLLARPRQVADICPVQARVVGALRLWAVAGRMRQCGWRSASERLGGTRAAAHLALMIEEIGGAWPEPFCVSPPCSPTLSHDEWTLAAMVGCALLDDRPGFDRLLAELLPADERERLYLSAAALGRILKV